MEIIAVEPNWNNEALRIDFVIGNTCNFKCWYCWPGSNTGEYRWGDFDVIIKHFSHLLSHYKKNGKTKFYLNLVGGEPTLWPKLGDFAREMTSQGCIISMDTNASRTLRWWNDNGKYFNRVILSCHHAESDIEHIKSVGDILYQNGCIVDASVLMDPNEWDKCVNIVDNLKTSKFDWGILATQVVHETVNYSQEQKEYIKEHVRRMPDKDWFFRNVKHHISNLEVVYNDRSKHRVGSNYLRINGLNKFKGWICNLGVDSINIGPNGTISGGCLETLYREDFIFNFYDTNFIEKFNPKIQSIICTKDICNCEPEINLKKYKIIPVTQI